MAGPTVPQVNKKLKALSDKLEFVRGEGYHYFVYHDADANVYETHSVYIMYTCHWATALWLAEANRFLTELKQQGQIS